MDLPLCRTLRGGWRALTTPQRLPNPSASPRDPTCPAMRGATPSARRLAEPFYSTIGSCDWHYSPRNTEGELNKVCGLHRRKGQETAGGYQDRGLRRLPDQPAFRHRWQVLRQADAPEHPDGGGLRPLRNGRGAVRTVDSVQTAGRTRQPGTATPVASTGSAQAGRCVARSCATPCPCYKIPHSSPCRPVAWLLGSPVLE